VAELVNPFYLQVINGAITLSNAAGTVAFSAGQAAMVASSSTLPGLVPMSQVPAGVLQMPNVSLSAAPGTIPSGSVIGGGGGGGGGAGATALAIGAAAGAAILISTSNESATVHH
jgi:hypothetical protein